MIKELARKSNIAILGGFVLVASPAFILYSTKDADLVASIALPLRLLGSVLIVVGCSYYAMAKGYSRWFGAFGLLSLLGFVILMLFPDKEKKPKMGGSFETKDSMRPYGEQTEGIKRPD